MDQPPNMAPSSTGLSRFETILNTFFLVTTFGTPYVLGALASAQSVPINPPLIRDVNRIAV